MSIYFCLSTYIVYILLFCTQLLSAQTGLQHWNTENGLSSNWVSQVIQDEEGYIWIATQDGLNRFDGYDFETFYYEPNNSNSLPANWTRSIATDSTGIFWLGTYGGLSSFQPKQDSFVHYPILATDSTLTTTIYQVLHTPKSIWCATMHGLYVKKNKQDHFKKVLYGQIKSIQKNRQGQVFCLTKSDIQVIDAVTLQVLDNIPFAENVVQQIFIDHEGILWAFSKDGLLRIEKERGNWEKSLLLSNNIPNNSLLQHNPIYEDQEDQLWIGGQNGISIVSADRKTIQTIPSKDFFSSPTFSGQVLAFFEDRDQNFWICTTEGVFLQSPYTKGFEMPLNMTQINRYKRIREVVQIDSLFFYVSSMNTAIIGFTFFI